MNRKRYSRDAISAARIAYGDRHIVVANVTTTLARTLAEHGNITAAEAALTEALGIYTAVLPPDHQYIASTEFLLGEVLLAVHRPREAEAVLVASMNRWKRADSPPWRAARSASALGEALYQQGRFQEAEKYLSESFRELSADTNPDSACQRQGTRTLYALRAEILALSRPPRLDRPPSRRSKKQATPCPDTLLRRRESSARRVVPDAC